MTSICFFMRPMHVSCSKFSNGFPPPCPHTPNNCMNFHVQVCTFAASFFCHGDISTLCYAMLLRLPLGS